MTRQDPVADVLLTNGTIASIRPVAAEDREGLVDLHDRVSEESLRLRFFSAGRAQGHGYVEHVLSSNPADLIALVALVGDDLVGLATAERAGESAEIAFLVDDRLQGTGLGTLLLEHLAAAARTADIRRFTAQVLADNHAMVQVFADAGFVATRRRSGDLVTWEISTSPSAGTQEAVDLRDSLAERRSLAPLLSPESVAVVGVRRDGQGVGHAVLSSVLDGGFAGTVTVVHPTAGSIRGVPAFPSLSTVPEHVDVAVIAVPARQVPAVVEDAARAGVSAAVILSSGFGELGGEGLDLQRRILETARHHGLRVLGPNCLGLLCNNPSVSLNATFSPVVPPAGGLAIASQSGGVGIVLLDLARKWGLGVHSFLSLGNQPDVSGNDLIAAWQEDPDVKVAALYLETFGNSQKFARVARRFSQRKPLLAVVGGRSASGSRAGLSHTAAAATPSVAFDALFAQTGVIACRSAEDLIDAARLLSEQPLPAGRRVGVISNAGGIGIVAADAIEDAGLVVPELSEELRNRLRSLVDGTIGVSNPVDLGAGAGAGDVAGAVRELLLSDEIDTLVIALVETSVTAPGPVLDALAAARASRPSLPVILVALGGLEPEAGQTDRITVYDTPDDAIRALGHAVHYAEWLTLPRDAWIDLDQDRADTARRTVVDLLRRGDDRWLSAAEQHELLAPYGIDPLGETAIGGQAAASAARRIGFPVVVKAAGDDLVHKTDRGLVRVGLTSPWGVIAAVREMAEELHTAEPTVLVQPVRTGVELAFGVIRHPSFGPLVMVAAGGVATNLLEDRAFLVPPLTRRDAARALRSLRIWPLLDGYRGAPLLDVSGLEELIVSLGSIARDLSEVAELDLNPVVATPTGPALVDIKVRLARTTDTGGNQPRQLSPVPRPGRTPSTPEVGTIGT